MIAYRIRYAAPALAWPVFLAVLLSACGEASGRDPLVSMRDSAGIAIADNRSPDDSAANVWWRIDGPVVDIGDEAAGEEYALFRVWDALRLADGRIAVANGTPEIRFYDAEGIYISTSGRKGGGPGEFQSIALLEQGPADSLLIVDGTARRVSVFTSVGVFARDEPIGGGNAPTRLVGRFGDGTWLASPGLALRGDQIENRPNELMRNDIILARWTGADSPVDTIGAFAGSERVMRVSERSGQIVSIEIMVPPFAKQTHYAVAGDNVYVGTQDAPEIRVHGFDGALRRIIRTGRAMEAVTEQHLQAMFERRLEGMPEERRAEALAAGRGDLPHGTHVPPHDRLVTDRDGNLWVADYNNAIDPAGHWTVYGSDGGVIARIALPERFIPYDIGSDWIMGRELDELDVEHVRSYRIVRE